MRSNTNVFKSTINNEEDHIIFFRKLINYDYIKSQLENKVNSDNLLEMSFKEKETIENNLANNTVHIENSKNDDDLFQNKLMNIIQVKNTNTNINTNNNEKYIKILDYTIEYFLSKTEVKQFFTTHKQTLEDIYKNYITNNNNNNNKSLSSSSFLDLTYATSNPDADPPKPYTSKDTPCMSSVHCLGMKLKWMKCTVARVAVRTAYESMNIPLLTMNKIIYKLCACSHAPAGEKIKVKCNNTKGQPGIVCVIPNQVYQGLFKLSFGVWKGYQTLSHVCFNPITPYL